MWPYTSTAVLTAFMAPSDKALCWGTSYLHTQRILILIMCLQEKLLPELDFTDVIQFWSYVLIFYLKIALNCFSSRLVVMWPQYVALLVVFIYLLTSCRLAWDCYAVGVPGKCPMLRQLCHLQWIIYFSNVFDLQNTRHK